MPPDPELHERALRAAIETGLDCECAYCRERIIRAIAAYLAVVEGEKP